MQGYFNAHFNNLSPFLNLAIDSSPHEKITMRDMKGYNSNHPENNQENIQENTACNDSKRVSKCGVLWILLRKPCRKLYCFDVFIMFLII